MQGPDDMRLSLGLSSRPLALRASNPATYHDGQDWDASGLMRRPSHFPAYFAGASAGYGDITEPSSRIMRTVAVS